jgi:hypothetical protein
MFTITIFFLLLSSFDSGLIDIPCIVSGIGSILLFFPLTYTLDLFAAALHVHKCTKAHLNNHQIDVYNYFCFFSILDSKSESEMSTSAKTSATKNEFRFGRLFAVQFIRTGFKVALPIPGMKMLKLI